MHILITGSNKIRARWIAKLLNKKSNTNMYVFCHSHDFNLLNSLTKVSISKNIYNVDQDKENIYNFFISNYKDGRIGTTKKYIIFHNYINLAIIRLIILECKNYITHNRYLFSFEEDPRIELSIFSRALQMNYQLYFTPNYNCFLDKSIRFFGKLNKEIDKNMRDSKDITNTRDEKDTIDGNDVEDEEIIIPICRKHYKVKCHACTTNITKQLQSLCHFYLDIINIIISYMFYIECAENNKDDRLLNKIKSSRNSIDLLNLDVNCE